MTPLVPKLKNLSVDLKARHFVIRGLTRAPVFASLVICGVITLSTVDADNAAAQAVPDRCKHSDLFGQPYTGCDKYVHGGSSSNRNQVGPSIPGAAGPFQPGPGFAPQQPGSRIQSLEEEYERARIELENSQRELDQHRATSSGVINQLREEHDQSVRQLNNWADDQKRQIREDFARERRALEEEKRKIYEEAEQWRAEQQRRASQQQRAAENQQRRAPAQTSDVDTDHHYQILPDCNDPFAALDLTIDQAKFREACNR